MHVPPENVEAFPRVNVPQLSNQGESVSLSTRDEKEAHSAGGVVAPTHCPVPADVETAHAELMAIQNAKLAASLDIPHSQRGISGSAESDGPIVEYLDAPDGRSVPRQCIYAVPMDDQGTRNEGRGH
jgi:hypothetical protein